MPDGSIVIHTASPDETRDLARAIGLCCRGNEVIALIGDLGAGKTLFTKGLADGLGVDSPEHLTSPTFVIVNEYPGRLRLNHVDAYRLSGPDDLEALGIDEMMTRGGVVAIEWADRVTQCLPADTLTIRLDVTGPEARRFELSWNTQVAADLARRAAAGFSV